VLQWSRSAGFFQHQQPTPTPLLTVIRNTERAVRMGYERQCSRGL